MRVIRLTKNYRSTPEICLAALDLIRKNPGPDRQFDPVLPSGSPVRLLRAASPHAEAIAIAKEIARMTGGLDMIEAGRIRSAREETRTFSEIAVLCRTHRQLALIENCLRHDDIPAVAFGRQDYLSDPKVTEALNHFRKAGCKENPRRLLEKWAAEHGSNECFARLMETSVLYDSMAAMLDALLLGEEADIRRICGKQRAGGAVRLMTLHGSKGLEFPVVFLAGLTDGGFPPRSFDGSTEQEHLEEERRLLYVGLTRARDHLIVSSAKPESIFVQELLPSVIAERVQSRTPQYQQLSLF